MMTSDHIALQDSVRKLIEREIEPYVDEWEAAEIFPAHEVFKKLGSAGFLGVNKPVEFGGMGLEGAVSIIHRQELEAIEDPTERAGAHRERTAELRAYNTALEVAGRFAYDDVIDPADTRGILGRVLRGLPTAPHRTGRKRLIDPC